MKAKQKTEAVEATFTLAQLLKAKRYANKKDLLNALLNEKEQYTIKQVDDIIEKFLKGKVQ